MELVFRSKKDNLRRVYSLSYVIELVISIIRCRLFINRKVLLFNYPNSIRGKRYIDFGNRLSAGYFCRFEVAPMDDDPRKRLVFGNNIQINDFVHISAIEHVEIGDGCLLASHVYISDNSHGYYGGTDLDSSPTEVPDNRRYFTSPVKIGKNVWIGEGVIIMPGVTIGDGCVIGAHSVVNKSIPSDCIAVGSPAKVVKKYSYEEKRWIKAI